MKKEEDFSSVRRKEARLTDHYLRDTNIRIITSRSDTEVRPFALDTELTCLFL